MLSRSRVVVVLGGIFVVWMAAGGVFVSAQGRVARGRIPQVKLPDLRLEGTLGDIGSGPLQILSNAGQTWSLVVVPGARIRVTGKATPDFLGPGQCIAFVADVDVKRSRVEEPVSKLLVFNPDLEWPLGAVEDQGPGSGIFQRGTQKNGERGKPGPAAQGADAGPAFGAAPDAGAFGKGDSDTGGRRPKSASAGPGGKAAAAPQSLEVRGQITSLKGGKMSLRVPNAPFKGPLKIDIAENADIDLDLSNPDAVTLAQKGDKVRAHGQQFSERMGQARELEITLSQPAAARNTKKKKG